MPNRPITATRKSKPLQQLLKPKVMRSWPVTLSMPTAASAKPSIIDARSLTGGSLPMPTKLQKVEEVDREELGRPELQRELGESGARKVISDDGDQRADERRGEGGGQRLVGPALLGHRMAVEGGGHRPGLARDVEQDRGDGAAEQRTPVDAGQHDDGRGRRHREGQRQQDGDAVGAAEARQHADDHAEQDADHHVGQIRQGQRDREAVQEVVDFVHGLSAGRWRRFRSRAICSSGPLGRGTRNQRSNTMKKTSGTTMRDGDGHGPAETAVAAHEVADQEAPMRRRCRGTRSRRRR